ncbi:MAG: PHP domain-containing protein [Theionarchaea archaeon]|nr:PHP domain-containing protein [Theionarchaea archaeon]MBU7000931.1 PHP domain-containing protein [Theionarchaea archaeon]MBU7021128.1 PHP domain-containing protein [Theionarchaea archaeon]MBU7033854.1 PHP domain-containing protein [Theionarchaea archaeon]MBU7039878.1 PHP domain-containing protein [Theionarchaea archaeon]
MSIDLHTHTTCSDGTLSPEALVQYAREKNLEAIAVTDHDSVAGNERAIQEGVSTGIEVVPGVELSAECEKGSLHILGLFVDSRSYSITEATVFLQKKRRERNISIIGALEVMGMSIEKELFLHNAYLGRPHIAQALVRAGYCSTIDEAFEEYLKRGASAYVEREKLSERATIRSLIGAGGIPVLAHPVTVFDVEKTVERLCKEGLKGIEVYYPSHTEENVDHFKFLAKQHGLFITGGSDFHGSHKPHIDLGCMKVPYILLKRMKEYRALSNSQST